MYENYNLNKLASQHIPDEEDKGISGMAMREHSHSGRLENMDFKAPRGTKDKEADKCFLAENNGVYSMSFDVESDGNAIEKVSYEHNFWSDFLYNDLEDDGFRNPTLQDPMTAAEFLSYLDLSKVMAKIDERYGTKDWHYRYSPEAMLKALILKYIKGLRWDTTLVRYLKKHPEEAKQLGFNGKIPSQQTFSYFINRRLMREGLYDIFDSLVIAIKEELELHGRKMGRIVSIDSTPVKALPRDPDARYNGHYKLRGYKIHGAIDADYNIPLAFNFTPANVGDSPQYKRLIERMYEMGITINKILADGAYASFENFAVANWKYYARTIFNLRKDCKINKNGTPEGIQKAYQRLRNISGFKPEPGMEFMVAFLMWHGKEKVVGAYYRNQHILDWEEDPVGMQKEYNKRSGIEAFHGHLKQQMNLEMFLTKRGLQRVEMHVLLCYIALLSVALCRIQHGCFEKITTVKCLV